ncbi:DUF6221 family protein [Streptomyces sp. NPDC056387]|uniref:DUF6221 family protein n=1 Tax=Streptomyces sp. NPDC056387 TaxID=3345803 RepID=UPI0035E071B4
MDDLVQFLHARLDEDEQTAREAGGRWMVLPVSGWVHTAPAPSHEWQHPGTDHHVASVPLDTDRAHIVRHDPGRSLAEVEAKRQILDEIVPAVDGMQEGLAFEYGQGVMRPVSRDLLRLLALPYADHPDYRDEWQPGS